MLKITSVSGTTSSEVNINKSAKFMLQTIKHFALNLTHI